MLSSEEVNNFLTTRLHFPNWKDALKTDRLEFLRMFVRKHVTYIPFQNVTMASFLPAKRHSPTHEEIIENGISGNGGLCISNNHFAKIILDSIGFKTYAIQGNSPITPFPNDHYMVVVKLNGEEYLVEVGMFHPNYDLIPLDPLKLPFGRVMFGFPYEYRYNPETNLYSRHHLVGGVNTGQFQNKDEENVIEFNLIPKKFDQFQETMTKLYADPNSINLRKFYLTRFLELSDDEVKNCKDPNPGFVVIVGTQLILGNRFTRKTMEYETFDQIVPSITKYFPQLFPQDIEGAIVTFTNFEVNNL